MGSHAPALALALALALLPACRPEAEETATDCQKDKPVTGWSGEWMRVEVAEAPQNPLAALVAVEVDWPATVELRWDCRGRTGSQTRTFPADGQPLMEIWGVRARTACRVEIDATDGNGEAQRARGLCWAPGNIPVALPEVGGVDGEGQDGAITVIDPMEERDGSAWKSYALGVDAEGEAAWLYSDVEGASRDRYVRDMGDGTLLLMMQEKVRRITPGGQTISETGNASMGASHHDALPLPGGDVLFMTEEVRTVDVPSLGGEVPLGGDRLVRVAGADGGAGGAAPGDIVWEWSAFDHLDTQRFPGDISIHTDEEGVYEWTHGNGLALTPDERSVLYSARSQSWVVKISLESGAVEWVLGDGGDFALDPAGASGGNSGAAGWFYNQHAPEMQADGSVLIYDNGNERPGDDPRYSRAVRYALDTDTMTATEVWSWTAPHYTYRMGDANLLGSGNYLITVGSPDRADAQVIEVSPDGTPVWTFTVLEDDMYRAERMEP